MAPRKKINYVNNKDFYEALCIYLDACNLAETDGNEIPPVPKYIGECMWHIARKLSTKGNFSGYSYRDDMIMDGVENCLLYIRNFDPNKTKNPFAYFTTFIWNAFIRRIQKEKKQMYIKYKSSHDLLASYQGTYDSDEIKLHLTTNADYINEFVKSYEESADNKKKKNIEAKKKRDDE